MFESLRAFSSPCLCFKLLSNINLFFQIINPFLCLFVNHQPWFHTPLPPTVVSEEPKKKKKKNKKKKVMLHYKGPVYTVIFKYSFIFGLMP